MKTLISYSENRITEQKIMTELNQYLVRTNDRFLLRVFLGIKRKDYSYLTVDFFDPESNFSEYIVSTSLGSINENKIYVNDRTNYIEIYILPPIKDIDCVISYFDKNNSLIDFENISIEKEWNNTELSLSEVELIQNTNQKFSERMYSFLHNLRSNNSQWMFKIEIKNNTVICKNLKKGKKSINAVFGKTSKGMLSTDFVFKVYLDTNQFIIPKEIIWLALKNSFQSDVALFELIKSDFHPGEIYYKMPISNTIKIDDNSQFNIKGRNLLDFYTPAGNRFNPDIWAIDAVSNFPIRKK